MMSSRENVQLYCSPLQDFTGKSACSKVVKDSNNDVLATMQVLKDQIFKWSLF